MNATVIYITGRECKKFEILSEAKEYADKWNDKTISVYKNRLYFSTIHNVKGNWIDNTNNLKTCKQ